MRRRVEIVIGTLLGLGFALPSLYGIIDPVASAAKWMIELESAAAIDQYRTLCLLVLAVGIIICIGVLQSKYRRVTLLLTTWLLVALLVGRVWALIAGDITRLLIIETIVETVALLLLLLLLRPDVDSTVDRPSA